MQATAGANDWIVIVLAVREETMSRSIVQFHSPVTTEAFAPRTRLGKRLAAIRNKAVQAGMKLLDEHEILEEVRRRRGELEIDETHLH